MKKVAVTATKYLLGILSLTSVFTLRAERPDHLWLGADISGTTFDEARGIFTADTAGNLTENTRLMKQYGMDAVRLRVWVDPRGGWSAKEDVLEMARRARQLGMEIMIDFHYSDWWADPEKQNIPAAWKNLSLEEMKKALADHTEETLRLLKNDGIDVRWVQVGNETRNGFLWPMGRIDVGNMENIAAYAALTTAGYDAVKRVYPDAQVIVHLDNGFDSASFNTIFDGLKEYGGKWDTIGMSVYPYWAMLYNHEPDAASTIRDAIANIRQLHRKYGCEVMIVEVGVDSTAPEEGLDIMNSLFDAVINDADGACTGVFYWAPEAFVTIDSEGNPRGYRLGAFTIEPSDPSNHNAKPYPPYVKEAPRPTVIMDSYTRAARMMR